MQPSNGIPVPLHRGETLQQYTQKFERWLAQRAQSLVKLRNDPSRERNFWFSFAYQRAEQIPERKRSIPNNTGNSCYDAEVKRVRLEEVLHVNTSGSAMATEELSSNFSLSTGVSSHEPLTGQPDYSGLGLSGGQPAPILPQRSRKEVLAQRTLTHSGGVFAGSLGTQAESDVLRANIETKGNSSTIVSGGNGARLREGISLLGLQAP
ncbi:hypothetical protein PC120_g853 [Phytophthora cactorum]|nr:hypothetical protein PC120_g853 [Phytophthora cactorum]